jgi:hypothetical protein
MWGVDFLHEFNLQMCPVVVVISKEDSFFDYSPGALPAYIKFGELVAIGYFLLNLPL